MRKHSLSLLLFISLSLFLCGCGNISTVADAGLSATVIATSMPTSVAAVPLPTATIKVQPVPTATPVFAITTKIPPTARVIPTQVPSEPSASLTQNTLVTHTVNVFFSNRKKDELKAYPVKRTTGRTDVATYALEEYFRGPTAQEQAAGYFQELELQGASNCGGKNFKLTLVNKKATVQFCKNGSLPGDLSGMRVSSNIQAILKQFSTVERVVILNSDGRCFDDLAALDQCDK